MFVAVMTERATSVLDRNAIREMWHSVAGGTGQICYRFIVCKAEDDHQQSLVAEQKAYGDVLFLDCEEGYAHGLLTKKVIAAMVSYRTVSLAREGVIPLAVSEAHAWCLDRELFMKVDDDTFVAANRFQLDLSAAAAN